MRLSNQDVFRRTSSQTLLHYPNFMRRNCYRIYKEIGYIICGWRFSILRLNSW